MSFPDEFSLEDIDDIKVMTEYSSSRVAVRLGLVCSLYLNDPANLQVRQRLAQCGDEYQALFGEHLTFYLNPDGEGRMQPYPSQKISLVDYVSQHPSVEQAFAPSFTGGRHPDDAASHSLEIFAASTNWHKPTLPAAHFAATIPFGWLKDKDEQRALQKLVHGWCQILTPFHGYAGVGLIQAVDMMEKIRTCRQAYPIAKRFPGLEIDNPSIVAMHIGDGIKGVNWLTAFGEDHLNRLGGKDAVREQLDDNFRLYDYPEGVLIQAGPVPQFGDINRQHVPRYYRQLSQIVKPLRMRFPQKHSFIRPGNGEDSTTVSNAWLARFDTD